MILSPASRERSNTTRATFEDVIRVENVLILAGDSANDEAEINRFLVALDDVMERLDKVILAGELQVSDERSATRARTGTGNRDAA